MQRDAFLKELGLRIRELRLKKGLTQQFVAAALNKEQQSYQRIEAGNTNASIYYLYEISQVLDVDLSEITKDLPQH